MVAKQSMWWPRGAVTVYTSSGWWLLGFPCRRRGDWSDTVLSTHICEKKHTSHTIVNSRPLTAAHSSRSLHHHTNVYFWYALLYSNSRAAKNCAVALRWRLRTLSWVDRGASSIWTERECIYGSLVYIVYLCGRIFDVILRRLIICLTMV